MKGGDAGWRRRDGERHAPEADPAGVHQLLLCHRSGLKALKRP